MIKRIPPVDVGAIFQEIAGANDRAAILAAGSFVEYAIERAIDVKLRENRDKESGKALFTESGIFGTFSQKMWGGYFLSIYGSMTRRDLNLIRDIRNYAAHNVNPISFEDDFVKSKVIAIGVPRILYDNDCGHMTIFPDVMTERTKFVAATQHFYIALGCRAHRDHPLMEKLAREHGLDL